MSADELVDVPLAVPSATPRAGRWPSIDRTTTAAGVVLLVLLVVAVVGPFVTPVDPNTSDFTRILSGPSPQHALGTDQLGRDVLARLVYGSRITLIAIAIVVGVAFALGLLPGLFAGYVGGATDAVLMRLIDMLISFPPLVLAIAIIGAMGPGLYHAMPVVGIIQAPYLVRVVRATVLALRRETYIEAARTMGGSDLRIVVRHVLPNIVSVVAVQLTNIAAFAVLAEAGLSFIGLGVVPPQASWGSLLKDAVSYMTIDPMLIVYPGLAITVSVLALNLFGDGVLRSMSARRRTIEH
ncbi:MAG: ABC transporter permease [Chloroflexota bacterium]|nr:ABC transporter permease [Chloroflexota bacterium]